MTKPTMLDSQRAIDVIAYQVSAKLFVGVPATWVIAMNDTQNVTIGTNNFRNVFMCLVNYFFNHFFE